MIDLVIGSFTLSIVHALIPNHWIPIITISKAENWKLSEAMKITGITAIAHSFGTVLLGIALGALGVELADRFELFTHLIAPLILIIIGLVYLSISDRHHHHHLPKSIKNKSKSAIIAALSLSMFLSPCLEMESYFLFAGRESWLAVWVVALVFLVTTSLSMILLVYIGYNGIERIKWDLLEKHEKKISGLLLIAIGAYALLFSH